MSHLMFPQLPEVTPAAAPLAGAWPPFATCLKCCTHSFATSPSKTSEESERDLTSEIFFLKPKKQDEEESRRNERRAQVRAAVWFYLGEGWGVAGVRLYVKCEMEPLNKLKFNYLHPPLSGAFPGRGAQEEMCLSLHTHTHRGSRAEASSQ